MALRPGKKDTGAATVASDPLIEIAGPVPPKDDRIYVDTSNVADLKATCDDAVERILTRPSNTIARVSKSTPSNTTASQVSHNPASTARGASENDGAVGKASFPPFKSSHFHADLRLVLGYLASFLVIGVSSWSYLVEKDWQKNKRATGLAVIAYVLLSSAQALDAYLQGDRIFVGKRKMLSNRIETEALIISSPSLPKATLSAGKDSATGRKWITPPVYTLEIEYARRSNGGKSLLRRSREKTALGHLGEWFTQDGEFIEPIFEKRLVEALQKAWGTDGDE